MGDFLVPDEIIDQVFCNCKKGCRTMACTCRKHNIKCTELCGACDEETCHNLPDEKYQHQNYDSDDDGGDADYDGAGGGIGAENAETADDVVARITAAAHALEEDEDEFMAVDFDASCQISDEDGENDETFLDPSIEEDPPEKRRRTN